MELLVLGPLEVRHNDRTVAIRGRIQPRLLSILALNAGNVVSLSTLIDTVWDDNPPATAKRQVQNALAQLRNQLSQRLIESVGQDYRLNLDIAEVDAHQFNMMVKQAQQERVRGHHASALARLREALGLWHGPALAGLTGHALQLKARHLDNARLAATEDRIELELQLGKTLDIAELGTLTAQHPLNQRLASHLMLALYRDHRTAEALAVYTDIQQRLADELGIDPGKALREQRTAILREDPSLAAPAVAERSVSRPVPAQLPADIAGFTGRHDQLAQLDSLPNAGATSAILSTIGGIGGVGKTALAIHWAHRNRRRFPDGQLYVNLRGFDREEPLAPLKALTRFLRAFDVPADTIPSDTESAAALFRSLVIDKRLLVVLDNARDVEQVRPLVPGGPETLTLVTSRNRLVGLTALHGAVPITVGAMSRTESLDVLNNLVGKDRLHADSSASRQLARLCADLPLALRIAGANLGTTSELSVAEYVQELEGPQRLERLSIEGEPQTAVGAALSLSVQALPVAAQQLFMRVGLIPGEDFHQDLVTVIGQEPPTEALRLLRTLVSGNLLEPYRTNRFRFHDLVREYAATIAKDSLDASEHEATADRIVQWYYDTRAETAASEYGNVVAAFKAWQDHRRSLSLIPVLQINLHNGLHLSEVLSHLDTAHQLALRVDDQLSLQRTTTALTAYSWATGDYTAAFAYGRQAVTHALAFDDDADGIARGNLGTLYSHDGNFRQAQPLLEEALEAATHSDQPAFAVPVGIALAHLLLDRGEYLRAGEVIRQLDAIECPPASTVFLMTARVDLEAARGELQVALELATRTLRTAREHSHLRAELYALQKRSRIRRRLNDLSGARADTALALELAAENGYPLPESIMRSEHALSLCDTDSPHEARTQLARLDETSVYSGAKSLQAMAAATLSNVYNKLREYADSIKHGTRALEFFSAMPYPLAQARVLRTLADSHDALGDSAIARQQREEALDIFTRLGVPVNDTSCPE